MFVIINKYLLTVEGFEDRFNKNSKLQNGMGKIEK